MFSSVATVWRIDASVSAIAAAIDAFRATFSLWANVDASVTFSSVYSFESSLTSASPVETSERIALAVCSISWVNVWPRLLIVSFRTFSVSATLLSIYDLREASSAEIPAETSERNVEISRSCFSSNVSMLLENLLFRALYTEASPSCWSSVSSDLFCASF